MGWNLFLFLNPHLLDYAQIHLLHCYQHTNELVGSIGCIYNSKDIRQVHIFLVRSHQVSGSCLADASWSGQQPPSSSHKHFYYYYYDHFGDIYHGNVLLYYFNPLKVESICKSALRSTTVDRRHDHLLLLFGGAVLGRGRKPTLGKLGNLLLAMSAFPHYLEISLVLSMGQAWVVHSSFLYAKWVFGVFIIYRSAIRGSSGDSIEG